MSIFESVQFLNESNFIEIDLLEESQILQEQIVFKFVKKDDVPKDFQDEALKILDILEKETEKKITEGILASTIRGTFGIGINKAKKKIENKIKNCYILNIPYRGIEKATNTEKRFFINENLVKDYIAGIVTKLGYKKVSTKAGAFNMYYKQGKDCIYAIDAAAMDGNVIVYIRCLKDTEENKEMMAGGKEFL